MMMIMIMMMIIMMKKKKMNMSNFIGDLWKCQDIEHDHMHTKKQKNN